ncbi:hypothetical protein V8E36_002960 [Tilletia maclaganii]
MTSILTERKMEYKTTARGDSGPKGRTAQRPADEAETQSLDVGIELDRVVDDVAKTISKLDSASESKSVWEAINHSSLLDRKTVEAMNNENLGRLAANVHRIKLTLYRYRGRAFTDETAQSILQLVHDTILLGYASPIPGTGTLYFQARLQDIWEKDKLGDANPELVQNVWKQIRVDLHGIDVVAVLTAVFLPGCNAVKKAAAEAAEQSVMPHMNPLNLEAMLQRQHGCCLCAVGCGRKLLWNPEQRYTEAVQSTE